jgi:LacI family transcriptional regulator
MIFHMFSQEAGPEEGLELVRTRSVDGLIVILYSSQVPVFKDKLLPVLQDQSIPFVVIHSLKEGLGCPNVGLDSLYTGSTATGHLVQHGYREIGCVTIKKEIDQYRQMVRGYNQALEHYSHPVKPELLFTAESFTVEAGYAIADEILKKHSRMPRSLFVTDDSIAYGIMEKMKEKRIRVPDEVALCGFGDYFGQQETFGMISLGLTSVRQPSREKGEKAAEMLTGILTDPQYAPGRQTHIIKPDLTIRKSCGC